MNGMPVDHIRYDLLTQQALRAVVRRVLSDVAKTGSLPGEHHFYVTFATHAPGVKLSPRLREQYPEEMTIVLQHQFWDLAVTEAHFEVALSFNGISEKLHVPLDAIKGFFDPSVQFGLQFETVSRGRARRARPRGRGKAAEAEAQDRGAGSRRGAARDRPRQPAEAEPAKRSPPRPSPRRTPEPKPAEAAAAPRSPSPTSRPAAPRSCGSTGSGRSSAHPRKPVPDLIRDGYRFSTR